MFALSPTKTLNLSSVTSGQIEDSQHNSSGLSSLFRSIPSVLQIDTPQPFSSSQLKPSPVPTTTQQEQARPPSQSSQTESAQISILACIKSLSHQKGPSQGHPNLPKIIVGSVVLTKQQKIQHRPIITHPPNTGWVAESAPVEHPHRDLLKQSLQFEVIYFILEFVINVKICKLSILGK